MTRSGARAATCAATWELAEWARSTIGSPPRGRASRTPAANARGARSSPRAAARPNPGNRWTVASTPGGSSASVGRHDSGPSPSPGSATTTVR